MKNVPTFTLTREGFEDLEKEEMKLTTKRPQVIINLSNAREQGDLSENAGYHAAREELTWIDSRVKEIKYIKRFVKIVDADQKSQVAFGNTVTLQADGQTNKFTIVSAMEADPGKNKISDSSPLGLALIGKKVGEEIELSMPGGKTVYKILEVS